MNAKISRPERIAHATVALVVLSLTAGCVDQSMRSPAGTEARRAASAGYTGCAADQNEISNFKWDSVVQTWNVTCKGKVYICTAVYKSGELTPETMSCAPAAR
jgi:hypothetical protein